MAGAVVSLPRYKVTAPSLTANGLQVQARMTALARGCTYDEAQHVGAEAVELLGAGEPHAVVLERCESLARGIVAQREAEVA